MFRFGAPGVEWSGQHKEDVQVAQLFFLPEQVSGEVEEPQHKMSRLKSA